MTNTTKDRPFFLDQNNQPVYEGDLVLFPWLSDGSHCQVVTRIENGLFCGWAFFRTLSDHWFTVTDEKMTEWLSEHRNYHGASSGVVKIPVGSLKLGIFGFLSTIDDPSPFDGIVWAELAQWEKIIPVGIGDYDNPKPEFRFNGFDDMGNPVIIPA